MNDNWWGEDPFAGVAPTGTQISEGDYARGRYVDRTYFSRSFPIRAPSQDAGYPGRFVHKVFDGRTHDPDENDAWSEEVVVDGARRQIKLLIAKEAGRVKELRIQKVPQNGDVEELLTLNRTDTARLLNMLRALDHVPAEGATTVRLDDDLIRDMLADPEGMRVAYNRDPSKFANLISDDVSASDVIALAHRREQVAQFRRLLVDADYFAEQQSRHGVRGREGVWQQFLEANPWILGVGLSGQLLTSWDPAKLEQVVRGPSIAGRGKRVDALMRTAGAVNSMVFAEIKHHETDLVERTTDPYRPDCWAPSKELSGGVTQIQQTVYLARETLTERKASEDNDGGETRDVTFLIRPRCYLIAGHLDQLAPEGNVHLPKLRSFELYRRNLYEPEIITFDELLARAEWHLAEAERAADSH